MFDRSGSIRRLVQNNRFCSVYYDLRRVLGVIDTGFGGPDFWTVTSAAAPLTALNNTASAVAEDPKRKRILFIPEGTRR